MLDFDTTEMAADFGEMLNGMAQSSVVFSSKHRGRPPQTVRAVIGEASNNTQGTEEGLLPEDALSFTVLASAFTDAGWVPTAGDVARLDGYAYRVRSARRVTGDCVWSFDCEAVAK